MGAGDVRSRLSMDNLVGQDSHRPSTLPHLSRSASTQPSSSSKYGFRLGEKIGGEEIKGKKLSIMLTRGASFRRQGSSGMTWADNWIFTDEGMFSNSLSKVADDKGASSGNGLRTSSQDRTVKKSTSDPPILYPEELQRSHSVGSGGARGSQKHRHHHRNGLWGLRWIKKNFRKAFK